METQIVAVQAQYPGVLLAVEVGYKFRFYGKDAEIASQVLSIMSFVDHNFLVASVPTQRVMIHVRRLVEAGYKVGIVRQTETAALKAAGKTDSKGGLFVRKLTDLFTKATMATADEFSDAGTGVDGGAAAAAALTGHETSDYLLCVYEHDEHGDPRPSSADPETPQSRIQLSLVAVNLSTGDVIHDTFEDGCLRAALETRLLHLSPTEVLLPASAAGETRKLIEHGPCPNARVEIVHDRKFVRRDAHATVDRFYKDLAAPAAAVAQLPAGVRVCLGVLAGHLEDFKMDKLLRHTGNFASFVESCAMRLPGKTLQNLELLRNSTTGEVKGSLYWRLKRTKTQFGDRQLQRWICAPLMDPKEINRRLDAVEELMSPSQAPCVIALNAVSIILKKKSSQTKQKQKQN